jgi:hypothetical protein
MSEDTEALDEILRNLNTALRATVQSASLIHRGHAAQLLDITNRYARSARTYVQARPKGLVWKVDPMALRGLTDDVMQFVRSNDWRRTLERSHVVMSALPGEPGGIPIELPKLPW